MYVVYYGKNNSILMSMAAALHLTSFSSEGSIKNTKSINETFLKFFEENKNALGRLLYMGDDHNNNKVFILNVSHSETILLPALKSVFDISLVPQEHLYLADTTNISNIYITLGSFLYKHHLWLSTATKLLYKGINIEQEKLNKVVSKAKVFSKKR